MKRLVKHASNLINKNKNFAFGKLNNLNFRNYIVAQYVNINNQQVVIKMSSEFEAKFGTKLENVIATLPFQNWLNNLKTNIDSFTKNFENNAFQWSDIYFKEIEIQSIDAFNNNRIGFIKFKVHLFLKKTKQVKGEFGNTIEEEIIPLPGVCLTRGGSVGILIVLQCEGKDYLLLVQQPRIPIGVFNFVELPAGMLDDDGNFSGVAAKEVKEETGLEIKDNDLIDLTQLCNNNFYGHFTSPGLLDEYIRLFLYKTNISKDKLNDLMDKITGNVNENEFIQLKVVPIDQAHEVTPDGKLLMALYLYKNVYNK
ncbi:hypothetical protein ABK040_006842 [Willaertia magna]